MSRVEKGDGWELRLGRYQDVLADVECDAVITDPPYSERVHSGMVASGYDSAAGRGTTSYKSWNPTRMKEFARWCANAACSWVVIMNDHESGELILDELKASGRYVFPPIPFVELGKQPRILGDGPASWTTPIFVARPRERRFSQWGSLPGAYVPPTKIGVQSDRYIKGGKPLWLMRNLVRDYSRSEQTIVDPCAGGGTTLLAAVTEGRRAIGAECDPDTFELAVKRLRRGYTPDLFTGVA